MSFSAEHLVIIEEALKHRRFHYERVKYSQHTSPDEKLEATLAIKRFNIVQLKVAKEGTEIHD
jgi:hypothetical protein